MNASSNPDTAEALLIAALAELEERGHADVSLRAIARRAGVSHAAPKYFYGDRAGLLTAAATVGFSELARHVRSVNSGPAPLAGAGRAYLDFALSRPALFDLMFRPSELNNDDDRLNAARTDALLALNEIAPAEGPAPRTVGTSTLLSWALAHGLAVLVRDGALAEAVDVSETPAHLAYRLLDAWSPDGPRSV